MVQRQKATSPPAVCSVVRSRARKVRRSLSQNSVDVTGSVVLQRVWMFEGINNQIVSSSQEQLSDMDTGCDDWCSQHIWFLSTNFLNSQHCSKCSKRILTKRAAYKCQVCKRLCHLKCAIKDGEDPGSIPTKHPTPSTSGALKAGSSARLKPRTERAISGPTAKTISSKPSTTVKRRGGAAGEMDFEQFVPHSPYREEKFCRYSRKTSNKRARRPFQGVEMNNNHVEIAGEDGKAPGEGLDCVDSVPQTSREAQLSSQADPSSGHTGQNTGQVSSQSQAKQRLTSMKHSFVKRCRSIKKKVQHLTDHKNSPHSKTGALEQQQKHSSDNQENSTSTSTSTGTTTSSERATEDRQAWVRSPVKTRLQARRLELRREASLSKVAGWRNAAQGEDIDRQASIDSVDRHFTSLNKRQRVLKDIQGRLEVVEQRVTELQTAIPLNVQEWKKLVQKINKNDTSVDYEAVERRLEEQIIHGTHLKQLEAEGHVPYGSSGTSDEVYLIPENPSNSSQEERKHVTSSQSHVTFSPINSMNNETMPSGMPGILKLDTQNDTAYPDHQTSTPVADRDISFRSASRNYERTHKILHTNITTINVDNAYTEQAPVYSEPMKTRDFAPPPHYDDVIKDGHSKYSISTSPERYIGLDEPDSKTATFHRETHGRVWEFSQEDGEGGLMDAEYKIVDKEQDFTSQKQEKVLSPEQEAVRSFLSTRKTSLGPNSSRPPNGFRLFSPSKSPRRPCKSPHQSRGYEDNYRSRFNTIGSPSPRHRSRRENSSPSRRSVNSEQGSNPGSPTRRQYGQQHSFDSSPPIASSTFREGNVTRNNLLQADMSPVSMTFRNDTHDITSYSTAKMNFDDSRHEEAKRLDRNCSSNSNLSCTFRNDSQMMFTNNEEDLQGFTRNHSFGIQNKTSSRNEALYQENDIQADGIAGHLGRVESSTEDDLDAGTRMVVEADIEPHMFREAVEVERLQHQQCYSASPGTLHKEAPGMAGRKQALQDLDEPREPVKFSMCEVSSTVTTTTTDEALSLTNVTEFTGDYHNSFAEAADHVSKSRWVNKDVFQFARDRVRPPAFSKDTLSQERIDETGDSRKPPLPTPMKRYSSGSEIDFLKEAERHLKAYKKRRSASLERPQSVTAGVCLQSLPRPSAVSGYNIPVRYDTDSETELKQQVNEEVIVPETSKRAHLSPSQIFVPESSLEPPESTHEPTESTSSYVTSDELPASLLQQIIPDTMSQRKGRSQSPVKSTSHQWSAPSPKHSPNKTRSTMSTKGSYTFKSETREGIPPAQTNLASSSTNTSPVKESHQRHCDSTREFEELERHLHDDSVARRSRLSRSLTHLHGSTCNPSNDHTHRQKSISCTNSIDGETRSIIESARYHFLNDKGMIKISSPSLKLMNGSPAMRHRELRTCKDIDEESDVLGSGSGSELSGVYVDNKFKINGFHGYQSCGASAVSLDSRRNLRLQENCTEGKVHFRSKRIGDGHDERTDDSSSDNSLKNHQIQENAQLEKFLQTVDKAQGNWEENVLEWIDNRYHGEDLADNEELEQELTELMTLEQGNSGTGIPRPMDGNGLVHNGHAGLKSGTSPTEESFYYSFQGQSGELRSALSPMRKTPVNGFHDTGDMGSEDNDRDIGPGIMYVIHNGTVQDVENYLDSDRTISEGELKEAITWALESENFDVSMMLLWDICRLIHGAEGDNSVEVFPAYLMENRWKPVFVILTKQDFQGEWDTFMGFPVYRRRYDLVSTEAAMVVNSDFVRTHPLSVDDFKTIRRAISTTDLQKKHRKITVINACPCKSKQNGKILEKGLCIVVHCLVKGFIPFDEEPFPREICGLPVDVREGYFRLGVATRRAQADIKRQMWECGMYSDTGSSSQASEGSRSHKSARSQKSSRSQDSRPPKAKTSPSAFLQESGHNTEREYSDISNLESEHYNDKVSIRSGSVSSKKSDQISSGTDSVTQVVAANYGSLNGTAGCALSSTHLDADSNICVSEDNIQENGFLSDEMLNKDQLLIGCSVGPVGGVTRGTLGGFVLLKEGELGFLTCGHVVKDLQQDQETVGNQVYHPACAAGQDRVQCGTVTNAIYCPGSVNQPGVDVAVVKVTSRCPYEAGFIPVTDRQLTEAGFNAENTPSFAKGKVFDWSNLTDAVLYTPVVKYGAESGLTAGRLYANGLYVRQSDCFSDNSSNASSNLKTIETNYGDRDMSTDMGSTGNNDCQELARNTNTSDYLGIRSNTMIAQKVKSTYTDKGSSMPVHFFKQLEATALPGSCTRFFLPGDSGALVFTCTNGTCLECLGMAIGYTSYGSCIITPIDAILAAMDCVDQFIDFSKCQSSF